MPQINNTKIAMLYGTAWKKDRTASLVSQALRAGFRAIDTAGQPKHYQEHFVGDGIRSVLSSGITRRESLHIQTKFTSISGQDPNNLPYDPNTSVTEQVKASVASSLHNLRHNDKEEDAYIDCLLLHSPLPTLALTLEAWTAMSSFVPSRVRSLGVSNVPLPILEVIYQNTSTKPSTVQNRFYAATGYDVDLREFCRQKGIEYQSFWTLTGNPGLLKSALVTKVTKEIGVSKEVALYGLVQGLGVVVINGSTTHMEWDMSELESLEIWKADNYIAWSGYIKVFEGLLQET